MASLLADPVGKRLDARAAGQVEVPRAEMRWGVIAAGDAQAVLGLQLSSDLIGRDHVESANNESGQHLRKSWLGGAAPLAYTRVLELFVETRVFAKRVDDLLSTEEFRELQLDLVARPTAGPIIPGTGGLRKLRWFAFGRGKRGGLRIIYFHHPASDTILLLFAFAKNERADLTASQREKLRRIVESEYP